MAFETTTTYTSSPYVNGVLWGYWGGSSSTLASKWSSPSLTYSFSGSWSGTQQAAVTNALDIISSVSNLNFSAGGGAADLTFNKYYANDGYLGFAYPPDPYYGASNTGQINYNSYYTQYWNDPDLQVGGVMFTTVVHELGHALGLGHPHDNAYKFPGVETWSDMGDSGLNQNVYTVMSYNDVGSTYNPNGLESYGFQTLGAFDIAALQHLYGASSNNTGDNTYTIPSGNGVGTYYQTIWDTGGTDEIVFNGSANISIDLHAATLDAADGRLAGGGISKASGIYGGFTIANGVVIENATAGSGDDTVAGNAFDNILDGGAGVDTVSYQDAPGSVTVSLTGGFATGADGNDTLIGFEKVLGSRYDDVIYAAANSAYVYGFSGNDTLNLSDLGASVTADILEIGVDGGAISGAASFNVVSIENLVGSDFGDTLRGSNDTNILNGGLGDDFIDGRGGSDTVSYAGSSAGVAVDFINGTSSGGAGNDTLLNIENATGSDYDDSFVVSGGGNVLDGGAGSDTVDLSSSAASVDVDLGAGTVGRLIPPVTPGEAFRVHESSGGEQSGSSVTLLAGGRYLVTWTKGINWQTSDNFGRLFEGDGTPVGGQFRISVAADGEQTRTDAVALDDGGFIAVWQGESSLGVAEGYIPGRAAYARRFDADGEALTEEIYLGQVPGTAWQSAPQLVRVEGGNFLAVWNSTVSSDQEHQDRPDIVGQLLDGNLNRIGDEFDINQTTFRGQYSVDDPIVLGNGNVLVTWRSEGDWTNSARIIGSDGNPIGDQFVLRDEWADAKTAALADGGFVAAWRNDARVFNADGTPRTEEFSIGNSIPLAITGLDGGGFAVVTLIPRFGSSSNNPHWIMVRTFDETGTRLADAYRITELADRSFVDADITQVSGGHLLVSWTQDNSTSPYTENYDVHARVIDGSLLGIATVESGQVLSNIENVIGTSANDTITGDANDNTLDGGAGDDTLTGGAGDDTLSGGNGRDIVNGGGGNDTLIAADDGADDRFDGGTGHDHLTFAALGDRIVYDSSNTTVFVSGDRERNSVTNIEEITGTAQDDAFNGNANAETFNGGDGADLLIGGLGDDTLNGGGGRDTADYSAAASAVTVDLTAGTASGGAGNDTLSGIERVVGSAFSDSLTGSASSDSLIAGAGDDTVFGTTGIDLIDGGAGTDTADYSSQSGNLTIDLTNSGHLAGDAMSIQSLAINSRGAPVTAVLSDGRLLAAWHTDETVYARFLSPDGGGDGTEFALTGLAGGGWEEDPKIVALTDGGFIATWQEFGGSGYDIAAVRYNSDGAAITPTIAINTMATGAHVEPSIVEIGADRFLVSWRDVGGTPDAARGQIVDSSLNDVGSEFRIDAGSLGDVRNIDASGISGGGAVVVWSVNGSGIMARHYDANGNASGNEFQVTSTTSSAPDVAAFGIGGYVVTYRSGDQILARLFEPNGTEFQVSQSAGVNSNPVIGALPAGGFVVAWQGAGQTVYVRSYDSSGTAISAEVQVGTGPAPTSITGLSDGSVYLAWTDGTTWGSTVSGQIVAPEILGLGTSATSDSFYNVENAIGGSGDDIITGDSGANALSGGAGNDTLDGGAGDDTLTGGAGDDIYIVDSLDDVIVELAGGGFDIVRTELADYVLPDHVEVLQIISGSSLSVTAGDGDDTLQGGGGDDVLRGNGGNDILFGRDGADMFYGGAGADIMNGGSGKDAVSYAGAVAGVAVDIIFGGSGGDAAGDRFVDIEDVFGSNFFDSLTANAAANTLRGAGGGDWLDGRGGDDFLYGETGNDTLHGGAGADRLDGGDGTDLASYAFAGSGVTLDLVFGGSSGDAAGDVFVDIEGAYGTWHFDSLTGSAAANTLYGAGGGDWLDGRDGGDFLYGGGGDDTLHGGAGADWMDGGDGSDWVSYAFSGSGVNVDLVHGGAGGDALGDVLVSIENLYGTWLFDSLTGSGDANTLRGAGGGDWLDGRGGDDYLFGDAGNDTLHGGAGADWMDGGAGSDWVSYAFSGSGVNVDLEYGGAGGDAAGDVFVSIENLYGTWLFDSLTGSGDANTLRGAGGGDWLDGRGGDDYLFGDAGNDTLHGGAGADRLDGGAGTDWVSYAFAGAGVNVDLVNGGSAGDAAGDTYYSIEGAYGSWSDDTLTGTDGANTLIGAGGDDSLAGRAGSDFLTGGSGDDLFIFSDGDGADRISDFTAGAGTEDRLDLQSVTSISDMSELLSAATQSGADTVIDTGGGSEITLVGVNRASLHDDDFLF